MRACSISFSCITSRRKMPCFFAQTCAREPQGAQRVVKNKTIKEENCNINRIIVGEPMNWFTSNALRKLRNGTDGEYASKLH